jgi:hypothetical protein
LTRSISRFCSLLWRNTFFPRRAAPKGESATRQVPFTTPNLVQPAPDIHHIDFQRQGFSNQERSLYQPYVIKLRNEQSRFWHAAHQPSSRHCSHWALGAASTGSLMLIWSTKETTPNLPQTTQYSQECTLPQ